LHNLPHQDVVKQLTAEAATIAARFNMLEQQFEKYSEDVKVYKDYLTNLVQHRQDYRAQGNLDNPANKEQKELLAAIKSVKEGISGYAATVGKNTLIENIKQYDKNIKDTDQSYSSTDN
jgi:uncharacterized phage infection (PIP) family protein YhgE